MKTKEAELKVEADRLAGELARLPEQWVFRSRQDFASFAMQLDQR